MRERKWQVCVAVVPVSMLALIFLGCAKEPVTLRAMVPGSVGSSGIGIGDTSGAARNGGAGQDGMSGSTRGNAGYLSGPMGDGAQGDGDWNGAGANGAGGQAGRGRGQAGGAGGVGDAGPAAGAGSLGGAAGAGDADGAAVGAN